MLITYKWINDLIDTGMDVETLSHALTMIGLEIEGVEPSGDDFALEVNVTPNRPDCLSIYGIARELRALTGKPIKDPEAHIAQEADSDFRIELLDTGLCPRYAGRVVKGIRIAPSPQWMKERLERCGIRSINNIVDITNYVLLELGHPLHAFDLSTLKGNTIRVGVAGSGNSIKTLDGNERKLHDDALLIYDAERPVAVAGVMGGADTEVSDSTTDIFIESAWFKPQSIRRTSKLLGLSTEASYRFERGADIYMLEKALDRAAYLVASIAGGKVFKKVDQFAAEPELKKFTARYARINSLLGTDIEKSRVLGYLEGLGLMPVDQGDRVQVTSPAHRHDMEIEVDVIEEVARLYGYDKLPTSMPIADISAQKTTHNGQRIHLVRSIMRLEGYSDAINYSFMNAAELDAMSLSQDDVRRNSVAVKNPLRAEDALMRTMLLPRLLDNLRHNISRDVGDVRLFEISRTFIYIGQLLPEERLHLCALNLSDASKSLYKDTAETFYKAKGSIERLLGALRIKGASYERSKEPFLHPGKSADIIIDGRRAGYLGVLSPKAVEAIGIKTKLEITCFDLDLDTIMSIEPAKAAYKSIKRYPHVDRDFAIIVDNTVTALDIEAIVASMSKDIVEEVRLFDFYKGKNIPEGKKSLAFSLRYRSAEKTLTDEEIEPLHSSIINAVAARTGGQLRGA